MEIQAPGFGALNKGRDRSHRFRLRCLDGLNSGTLRAGYILLRGL